jgi:Xaa-Pro aminopeptidase
VGAGARVDGRWAHVARTLVVGGDGGAVRRAQVAAESALRAAAAEATPGTDVDWLADEVRAELGSFGVEVAAGRVVAGTGLARREAPLVGGGTSLEPGHVLVVAPAARVPDGEAVVRLAATLVVADEGGRTLGDG